jgi:hypothetical protein
MGAIFTADTAMGTLTYILGFTSLAGEAGRLYTKPYLLPKPHAKAFETWMRPDLPYAFVDFRKYNRLYPGADERFYMAGSVKGNMYHTYSEAEWNKVFDGVMYIREMRACTVK